MAIRTTYSNARENLDSLLEQVTSHNLERYCLRGYAAVMCGKSLTCRRAGLDFRGYALSVRAMGRLEKDAGSLLEVL